MKRKRKTLLSQIQTAPEDKKLTVAMHGRAIGALELAAESFLALPKTTHAPEGFSRYVCESLFLAMCAALMDKDADAFRAVAALLEERKPRDFADRWRALILQHKCLTGDVLTPDGIAKKIGYRGDMDVFRRMLNELDVSFKNSPGGRPRKNSDK